MPNRTSPRGPAEVFGYPVDDDSEQAQLDRKEHRCPFLGQTCWKQSRLIDYPFGVCSVDYNGETIATCPSRFRQDERVFKDIADHYFGTRHDLIPFSEVRTSVATRSGRRVAYTFDYVLVKHKPLSSEIEDFVAIEVQTVDTTNTGKLVAALEDFTSGKDIHQERYGFGLNWANVWKRCFSQILREGVILERWGQKIYWVAQEPAFEYLVDSHGLHGMAFDQAHSTVFMTYDLVEGEGQKSLARARLESATMDQLFEAFQHNAPIPSKDEFVQKLKEKVEDEGPSRLRLRLDTE
jgi:hypothetical protein